MDKLKEEVRKSLEVLRQGGIILYPTDTVWGIGCDATSEKAVSRLLDIKGRDQNAGFVMLADSEATLNRFVPFIPESAYELLDFATPESPMTLIYPEARGLATGVCAADGSAAFRVVQHPFCQRLIFQLKAPLTSSSANLKGKTPPRRFADIDPELLKAVDHIVLREFDTSVAQKPSSIIKIDRNNRLTIIRP
jgi:L-threonylcarbamoyladenylate synthase